MREVTLWISESDVASVLDLGDAIAALSRGFGDEGRGRAFPMEKTMLGFGDHATLHALGAAFEQEKVVGTKTWAHTPGGADPVLLLFDTEDGSLIAVVEAFALGQLRTAGTAALATDRLARADATRLAIIGTGKQALAQVAAVAAVRRISEVIAYSRRSEPREHFAEQVGAELGVVCKAASSAEEAVAGADVVTLVTRATEPVLTEAMVEAGVHINALGAIALDRREFEPQLLAGCSLVVTDSLSQSRNLSSELREFYGAATPEWAEVRTLGEIVERGVVRSNPLDITLFKGMGSGIEDLALGCEVLARVRDKRQGVEIRRRGRVEPALAGVHSAEQGGQGHE